MLNLSDVLKIIIFILFYYYYFIYELKYFILIIINRFKNKNIKDLFNFYNLMDIS